MAKIWLVSDWHFGHDKEFIYGARGFGSMQEMCEELIRRHNSLVNKEDTVYFLGDAVVGDTEYGFSCLRRLNGRLHMLRGNHDTSYRVQKYEELEQVVTAGQEAVMLEHDEIKMFLCHYPVLVKNKTRDAPIISVHGHTHGMNPREYADQFGFNVCVDAHGGCPVSLEEVVRCGKEYYAAG